MQFKSILVLFMCVASAGARMKSHETSERDKRNIDRTKNDLDSPEETSESAVPNGGAIRVASVGPPDFQRLQALSSHFTDATGIEVEFTFFLEDAYREGVLNNFDGQAPFDVVALGSYETPFWSDKGWLTPLDFSESWDAADLLNNPLNNGLLVGGELMAAPFYGESSFTMYRTDLATKVGITIPETPTWADLVQASKAMADAENGVYGICLRGQAGWGDNMALITALANSFGARWFDLDWRPQFDSGEWERTLRVYVSLLAEEGPPNANENSFPDNLLLFSQGHCAIWVDATVAAANVLDPAFSLVSDHVGFARAPNNGLGKDSGWLWSWALGVPTKASDVASAKLFVEWATSKEYSELVASTFGWMLAPPGTRRSLYENPAYQEAAFPFAALVLDAINFADPMDPCVQPVPYNGVQFVSIPEFIEIGDAVGGLFEAALTGAIDVQDALREAQLLTVRAMQEGGYFTAG